MTPISDPQPTSPGFEEVLAAYLQAVEAGRAPDRQELLRRHPDLAADLQAYFANRDDFERVAGPLAPPPPLRASAAGAAPPLSFGDYEVLGTIAAGGMGVVYRARQISLDRTVALKMMRAGPLASADDVQRFEQEARAAAELRHPHIVPIHQVGTVEVGPGVHRPYFTMDLVEGGNLARHLAERELSEGTLQPGFWPREQRWAAGLLATVARAVHFAHQHRILHRDLKPANILLDEHGQPHLTDFGLAKRLQEGEGLTQTQQVVGTPGYLAPEQATDPKGVTTAVDVYGLGAVLYHVLTGQPPFKAETPLETVLQTVSGEPPRPRALNPQADRDLETICLKCLEKDPQRRYGSAEALAEDLESWLDGRPIKARPAGRVERGWRWCRRNPVPSGAAAAVLVTAALAFGLIVQSRNEAVELADQKGRLAEEKNKLAEANGKLYQGEREQKQLVQQQKDRAERRAALMAFDQGYRNCLQGNVPLGLLWLARCQELAPADAEDLRVSSRANLAVWRGQMPALLALLPHDDEVLAVGFSSGGKRLVTGGADKTARLWDAITGQPVGKPLVHVGRDQHMEEFPGERFGQVVAAALSPDGKYLATGTAEPWHKSRTPIWEAGLIAGLTPGRNRSGGHFSSRIVDYGRNGPPVWDLAKGEMRKLGWDDRWATVWAVAFSPDGRFVLTGEGRVYREDPARTAQPPQAGGFVQRGSRSGGNAVLWDVATGEAVGRSMTHGNAVVAVAFSPDGKTAATGSIDGTTRLWDAATTRPRGDPLLHDGPVVAVAFSPDGRWLATAEYVGQRGLVLLWDLRADQPTARPLPHSYPPLAVAFSPDGRVLLTGGGDPAGGKGEARFWDLGSGRPLGLPLPHPGAVQAVAYGPDGRSVLTACTDRNARLWEAVPGPGLAPLARYDDVLAFAPAGKTVLRGEGQRQLRACAAATGQTVGPLLGKPGQAQAAFLSTDGEHVFTVAPSAKGSEPFLVASEGRLWRATSDQPVGAALELHGLVTAAAIGPGGKRVLTAVAGPYGPPTLTQLWDPATGQPIGKAVVHPIGKAVVHPQPVRALAFSPDGRRAAAGSDDHTARLYDADTGEPIGEPLRHDGAVRAVIFSPDGRWLATGSDDRSARLWDAATGKSVGAPLPMNGEVRAIAFSPDSRRLVTGSDGKTARLWDVATGKPVGPELGHDGEVRTAAFSPDGRFVLTGSYDRTARLWEVDTGSPIGVPLTHRGPVLAVGFSPDGRSLFTHSWDREGEKAQYSKVGDKWERRTGTGWDGTGRVWPMPLPLAGSPEQVTGWAQALTGLELDADDVVRPLDAPALAGRRQILRDRGGPDPSGEDRLAWHRREADGAEARGQWFAAAWHLQRLDEAGAAPEQFFLRRGRTRAGLGQFDLALQDADEAVRTMAGQVLPLLLRGEIRCLRREWQRAVEDLNAALKLDAADLDGQHLRALAQLELGQLDLAAADLEKAAGLRGAPPEVEMDLAFLRLRQQNSEGYQTACSNLLSRSGLLAQTPPFVPRALAAQPGATTTYFDYDNFGQMKSMTQVREGGPAATFFEYAGSVGPLTGVTQHTARPTGPYPAATAAQLAWVCCVAPNSPEATSAALRLAGAAASTNPRHYPYARSLGAALYRSGHLAEAIKQLEAAASLREKPTPSVWLFLAMAHYKSRNHTKAGEWLVKAHNWIDQAQRQKPDGKAGPEAILWHDLPWAERLALETLRREAEALLSGSAEPKK